MANHQGSRDVGALAAAQGSRQCALTIELTVTQLSGLSRSAGPSGLTASTTTTTRTRTTTTTTIIRSRFGSFWHRPVAPLPQDGRTRPCHDGWPVVLHVARAARASQEHGKSMAIPWQEHAKSMARAWQEAGKNRARTWQEHGKNVARTW